MRSTQILRMAMLTLLTLPAAAQSIHASYDQPSFDRWNYPFNFSSPGTRPVATTFSSGLIPGQFDDRDGQFLNSFITAGEIAPGQGVGNYQILSASFTATLAFGEFGYSDTYDPGTLTTGGTSIDLLGTGFRNGLNAFAYGEDFTWGFGDPTSEDLRNAFATDNQFLSGRDVSNQKRDGLTVTPFAVGQIAGETSGTTVNGSGQLVTFDIDLFNPDAVAYLQEALDFGILSLTVSSLHETSQQSNMGFPGFATKEHPLFAAPTLDLEVRIVPAPASITLLALGGVAATRRRRSSPTSLGR